MKYLLLILLLVILLPATSSYAQLSPLDQRSRQEKREQKNQFIGKVYLNNGSIITGEIKEELNKVSVATFDGSLFVYEMDQVLRIEYDSTVAPKSGAVAIILSIVFPGLGNGYAGQQAHAAIWGSLGFAGAFFMLWPEKIDSYRPESIRNLGGAMYLGATVISAASAYHGCKRPRINNTKVPVVSLNW